jgi:hypothetical protein
MTDEKTQQPLGVASDLNAELGILREKVAKLNLEQSNTRDRIKQIELELIKIQHKVYVGCVVKNKYGVLFEVSKIVVGWESKPPIYGHKQKKDGAFSLNEQYIGNCWEIVA